ncbi:TRAP transporter substrate-binding protein [Caballeronia sp. LZ034LL]|uniref:TRAP transporter substrate-binding protein n=1 Tax=Caballeronia sp. LZ034LL TaxID=3038567 RepID=UPI002866C0F8|nr:TRAP transporter substrate-binding protein [Caballeronia sp. LZ034LL]MDR5835768.1 TRAP transporter substrate-binding protein [Caballeronia sp. LZ034LL]
MQSVTRRSFLKTVSAATAAGAMTGWSGRASAAEFRLKYANFQPVTHPMTVRVKEMAQKIREESNGRIELQVFPNAQLGSDVSMFSQLRAGSIDFLTYSPLSLGVMVPDAQISGVGFAFPDYEAVWKAMDGDLGAYVRQKIDATPLFAFEKIFDGGYRQITTSTRQITQPDQLKDLKIRVPSSPLWTSVFRAFGASPTTLSLEEVYSALQTHVVDGQENPLVLIDTTRFYEVQKYCALTNHMWDGFWFLGNTANFKKLPPDMQEIVRRNVNAAALKERADVKALNDSLITQLKGHGLQFNEVDHAAFRDRLKSAGFYADWKKRFGETLWAKLEQYAGRIG